MATHNHKWHVIDEFDHVWGTVRIARRACYLLESIKAKISILITKQEQRITG